MKQAQAITAQQCPALTAHQVEKLNAIYRNTPTTVNERCMTFGLHTRDENGKSSPANYTVECLIRRAHDDQVFSLELFSDCSNPQWTDFTGEVQLISWCVNHRGLMDCLQHVMEGSLTVTEIRQSDGRANVLIDQYAVPVDFTICNQHGTVNWRGRLHNAEELIKQDVFENQSTATSNWTELPALIRIFLDEFEISKPELDCIEAGAFIRLHNDSESLFNHLTLECLPLKYPVSTDGSTLRLI